MKKFYKVNLNEITIKQSECEFFCQKRNNNIDDKKEMDKKIN